MQVKYYDIGLNLFCKQFPEPEKIICEAVSIIPLDRILVETDAPYLTPKNVPGLDRTNVPQNIQYVVRDLAKYMKVSEDVLMENARKNTERIFHL